MKSLEDCSKLELIIKSEDKTIEIRIGTKCIKNDVIKKNIDRTHLSEKKRHLHAGGINEPSVRTQCENQDNRLYYGGEHNIVAKICWHGSGIRDLVAKIG